MKLHPLAEIGQVVATKRPDG